MVEFKVGDRIVWGSFEDLNELRTGTVTKINACYPDFQTVWVDNDHVLRDGIMAAYCLPEAAIEELKDVLKERARLKKAFDDSMALVYQLRNKYSTK
jgi:hypothetical protein